MARLDVGTRNPLNFQTEAGMDLEAAFKRWTWPGLLLLGSAYLLFFHLGQGSLWDWDEAIYAAVALTMDTGDWFSLHLNGRYWPEKPPLILWGIAVAYRVFGVSEFSARLPTAVFGWLSVLLVYVAGRRWFAPRVGLLAGVFLISTLHFLILSRTAMLDVPLAFFMSLSVFWYWEGREGGWPLIAAGAAWGLAVMTKGPVGLLPLLVLGLYLVMFFKYALLARPAFWGGIVVGLAIAAPWHIGQALIHGSAFTDYYFKFNLLTRLVSAVEGHTGSVFYYVKYIGEHFFSPWLCYAGLACLVFGVRFLRPTRLDLSGPIAYVLVWCLTPLVFFSLARTKIAGYILPAYLPLALLTAKLTWDAWSARWVRWALAATLAATGVHLALTVARHGLTVDRSPEVKELAARGLVRGGEIIAYQIPPNAPTFYFFPVPVRSMNTVGELADALERDPALAILCTDAGRAEFSADLPGRKFRLAAVSGNQKLKLVVAE